MLIRCTECWKPAVPTTRSSGTGNSGDSVLNLVEDSDSGGLGFNKHGRHLEEPLELTFWKGHSCSQALAAATSLRMQAKLRSLEKHLVDCVWSAWGIDLQDVREVLRGIVFLNNRIFSPMLS